MRISANEREALLWVPERDTHWRGPAPRHLAQALGRLHKLGMVERSEPHPVTRLVDYSLTALGRKARNVLL